MPVTTPVWISDSTDPYENIAAERTLLEMAQENECILYLWQNERTVVIGKNQNAFKEVHLSALEQDGGHLARRLSGGGAVFHDLGNLNFTFCARKPLYSVERQLKVILRALDFLGLHAQASGRNDLTLDGRKFSGNAFYHNGTAYYHHGTLLVSADMEKMTRYLNVSAAKMAGKGVDSVRSRVVNLTELSPGLSLSQLREALVGALGEVYRSQPYLLPREALDSAKMTRYRQQFSSPDWLWGRSIAFTWQWEHRFAWGGVEMELAVKAGVIEQARIYTDALDPTLFDVVTPALTGLPLRELPSVFEKAGLCEIPPLLKSIL